MKKVWILNVLHRRAWRFGAWSAAALCGLLLVLFWPMDTAGYLDVAASCEVLDQNGELLHPLLNESDAWCFPRKLKDISPLLIKATIAAEDKRFYAHPGVDPIAVARAAWQDISTLAIQSGASTISMQVVKRSELGTRTWLGKMAQAIQAIRLELHVDKSDILTAYLNSAPYGLNLVGCEAAARRYFGKTARELTLSEAALLGGLPKAPSDLQPLRYPEKALQRRDYVLRRMKELAFITTDEYATASRSPLGTSWREFPKYSPHLAMKIKNGARTSETIYTTIDAGLQASVEAVLTDHLKMFQGNVRNAAAIVVEVETARVLARAGSANFFDASIRGQVDACRALRSPGSTLKPFVYALAMENNCLYATEMLQDGALDYGLYQPVNFDGTYRGLIPAYYALRRSLNIPAVAVLDRVGCENFYRFLKRMGFTSLKQSPEHYGLGLTLGNCEVKLEELAAAYCAIAGLGVYRPLRVFSEQPPTDGERVLDKGTCIELFTMLEQPLPAEFDTRYLPSAVVSPRACWKTGTSTGMHDAWAIVFNTQYVVAIWLGNSEGTPSRRLVGAEAALPLAARLFRSLPPKLGPAWPDAGDSLHDVAICAVTGLPVSKWCPRVRYAKVSKSHYLHRLCDVHQPTSALASGGSARVVERWPGTPKGWDLARIPATINSVAVNAPARRCDLRILAPADGSEFVLTGEVNADRIRLDSSSGDEANVHWYLDGAHIGASAIEESLFLDLEPGRHKLTCMTLDGEQDTSQFTVVRPKRSPWQ